MAAPTDSSGTMKYWHCGLPFDGVQKPANDCGSMQFWMCGLPATAIFPAAGSPPSSTSIALFCDPNDLFNLMIPA